jgi:hypothetical protein
LTISKVSLDSSISFVTDYEAMKKETDLAAIKLRESQRVVDEAEVKI